MPRDDEFTSPPTRLADTPHDRFFMRNGKGGLERNGLDINKAARFRARNNLPPKPGDPVSMFPGDQTGDYPGKESPQAITDPDLIRAMDELRILIDQGKLSPDQVDKARSLLQPITPTADPNDPTGQLARLGIDRTSTPSAVNPQEGFMWRGKFHARGSGQRTMPVRTPRGFMWRGKFHQRGGMTQRQQQSASVSNPTQSLIPEIADVGVIRNPIPQIEEVKQSKLTPGYVDMLAQKRLMKDAQILPDLLKVT